MIEKLVIVVLGLIIQNGIEFTLSESDVCGSPKPIAGQTCVSIRLPWNEKPSYFCVEKDKFKYRNQCANRRHNYCGTNNNNNSLKVATPWDCCPLVSNPDSCANHDCPPAPYSRKCQAIPPDANNVWECCNSYFCEEDSSPDQCHFKQLEPECQTAPKGKTNCVAFTDQYGCCPKYQCDGDAIRPGQCPAEVEAIKYMNRFNASNTNANKSDSTTVTPPTVTTEIVPAPAPAEEHAADEVAGPMAGGGGGARMSKMAYHGRWRPRPYYYENQIPCIGDFNCPGVMKCCSNDWKVYIKEDQDYYTKKNKQPTYGHCVEKYNPDEKKKPEEPYYPIYY